MDAQILTVHWHDGEQPVYSAHYQPAASGASERLATGGGDNNVRLWRLVRSADGSVKVEYLSTLSKHTQAVNVVRFDSTGALLATAGDDGCAMIWHRAEGIVREFGAEPDDEALESWNMKTLCRSSSSEIYDLAWSPDSRFIITGSTDNVARVYDVSNGQQVAQFNDHSHYVQGVAWDPRGGFLATQSADRSVHVHCLKCGEKDFKTVVLQKSSRAELPTRQVPEPTSTEQPEPSTTAEHQSLNYTTTKASMLYHTESLRSFFRRLTFSPDGNFLLTPAGVFKYSQEQDKDELLNTVYIYTRKGLNKPPIAHLPGFKKPALVVSFSPVVYELDKAVEGAFQLPYKMIYAVATVDAVHIFDTQSLEALGSVSSLHYGTLTDLAWNSDGKSLLVSSADGFCTTLQFSSESLGTPLAVDYKTLLPEDALDEKLNTPKSTKKRPVSTHQSLSAVAPTPITQSPVTTTPSSPLSGPLDAFAKKTKVAPVATPLQKPAPVMNTINHLIRKKKKISPTPVTSAIPMPTKPVISNQEAIPCEDVVMIDEKEDATKVITIDDESTKTPVKEKKRISPTLVTEPPAN